MGRIIKWAIIIGMLLSVAVFAVFRVMQSQTKKKSPEERVVYTQEDLEVEVFYNRPYKKGREIFGGLVPYDVVWRTGANEATTFETNKDMKIQGQLLKPGKYTLWTIPNPDEWQVIWNDHMYPWGVNFSQEASRDPQYDVVVARVPPMETREITEQFTISLAPGQEGTDLILQWDRTRVAVPMAH